MFPKVLQLGNENVPEMDGGDSCTMWMYLKPLNCTSKNDESDKFYVVYTLHEG